jgi:hypothetical protein
MGEVSILWKQPPEGAVWLCGVHNVPVVHNVRGVHNVCGVHSVPGLHDESHGRMFSTQRV